MKVINEIKRFFVSDKLLTIGVLVVIIALLTDRYFAIPPLATLFLFLYAYVLIGRDIIWATIKNLRYGNIFDENFLMVIASAGAFLLGYYGEAVAVLLFYKAGEYMQEKASGHATDSIQAMLDVRPESANVVTGGSISKMQAGEVPIDSIIKIYPGEKVPLDGLVTDGISDVNTAALTGEAAPRAIGAGDEVLAGFVNGGGLLTVKTTKEFGETVFSKVIRMVKDSQKQKARTEKFITRFAKYYTPAVVVIAAMVAVLPPLLIADAAYSTWIYRALVFLVISCPCALLLSVPLSFFAGIGVSARNGIFVKGGQFLEALAHAKTMVFDKTGTLTTGEFEIKAVILTADSTEEEVLAYAATAEQYSSHPIGRCIVNTYKERYNKELSQTCEEYKELPGHGVSIKTGGKSIKVGKGAFVGQPGNSLIHVQVDGIIIGTIEISDKVRPNAAYSIAELRRLGIDNAIMLSGDYNAAAMDVAKELNLDSYRAELLPADKLTALTDILDDQPKGAKTVFVGDGINDAPSLARSDVGIAMGGAGSDAALEASDIVLMDDDLTKLPMAFKISRKTRVNAYQNIVGAIGLKVVVMILGTLGFAPLWLAIFADVGVAMLAVLNSLRVLRQENYAISEHVKPAELAEAA